MVHTGDAVSFRSSVNFLNQNNQKYIATQISTLGAYTDDSVGLQTSVQRDRLTCSAWRAGCGSRPFPCLCIIHVIVWITKYTWLINKFCLIGSLNCEENYQLKRLMTGLFMVNDCVTYYYWWESVKVYMIPNSSQQALPLTCWKMIDWTRCAGKREICLWKVFNMLWWYFLLTS